MTAKTYHTKPDFVTAWKISGEDLAVCLAEKTALPLGLELAAYRFVGATESTPAKLTSFRFKQLRKRFDEGDFIVQDESGKLMLLSESEFSDKYIPA